jgi:cell division protein FtsN
MDQKRILWIVAASGLFLLVVVGVALFLASPKTLDQQNLGSLQATGNTWIKGEVKNPELYSATETENIVSIETNDSINDSATQDNKTLQTVMDENKTITVDTVTLIAGTTNVYTQNPSSKAEESSESNTTIVTLPTVSKEQSKSQNVTVTSVAPKTQTTNAEECVETPKVSATSNTAKTTTKTTTASSSKTTSSKTVTESKPVADQFWVQVASFTGKKNAEDARAALLEEKINSEIFTYKDSKGVIYYRLRVGPYTTASEAEYWNSRIKLIDQFAGTSSYVVNSTGKAQN